MHAYAPLLSAFLPQRFDIPLRPSNVPDPLPQILALPLQHLSLKPPPLPCVSLQGQGGPLLLPSVAHAHYPFLTALRLRQGVPHLLTSNMPAPLYQILALPLQQGWPRLQTSAVIPHPPISALLLQRDVIPLQPSAVRDAPTPPPLSVSIQGRGGPPCSHATILLALLPQLVEPPLQPSAVNPPLLPQI